MAAAQAAESHGDVHIDGYVHQFQPEPTQSSLAAA